MGTHHVLSSLASFSNQESDADINQLIFILKPLMAVWDGGALKNSLNRLKILHDRTQPFRMAVFHF